MSQGDGGSPMDRSPDIPMISLAPSNSVLGEARSGADIEAQVDQDPSLAPPTIAPVLPESNTFLIYDGVALAPHGDFIKFDPSTELGKPNNNTEVDIIGVPAIGGDPEKTWTAPNIQLPRMSTLNKMLMQMPYMYPALSKDAKLSKPAWIISDIRSRRDLQKARVALYDHGDLEDGVTLKILAHRLLLNIQKLREKERTGNRPIFFVCHSTGGLVVKMALVEAQRASDPLFQNCVRDCYGVTFLGTPHRGSSYLSMANFSNTIRKVMNLSCNVPQTIADHLQLDHPLLRKTDSDFKSLAADLQVWTFFETIDSDLTNSELVESERYPFHAPITSIKSALLNLRHEVVYPLLSDHTRCASFEMGNEQTKEAYLEELAEAVKKARELKKNRDYDLGLENQVRVEVIGFYTTLPTVNETSIRVVSTAKTLSQFLRDGPASLLNARLREVSAPLLRPTLMEVPDPKQYLRHDTRASSLLPTDPKMTGARPPGKRKANKQNRISAPAGIPTVLEIADPPSGEASPPKSPTASVASDSPSHTTAPTTLADRFRNTPASSSQPDLSRASGSNSRLVNGPGPSVLGQSRRLSEVSSASVHLQPTNSTVTREDLRGQRRLSEGAIHQSSTLRRSDRPDDPKQKLLWIHVPFNVPNWVKNVLERVSVDQNRNCHEKLLSIEHWESKHQRGRHSEHHACFLKPGCSFIENNPTIPLQMCLYLPYLHFDTYKVLVKRRNLIKARVKQGRCRPVPQYVANLDSLEFRAIWQFLGHDPPINCRRTLDQFGYPSLLDTRARDDDQMLYKLTRAKDPRRQPYDLTQQLRNYKLEGGHLSNDMKERRSRDTQAVQDEGDENDESGDEPDEDIRDGNVLMVDQLWLWIVDGKSTVTFFPRKEPLPTDGRLYQQADLRNSIFNEVNADLTSKCENAFDLAALIALHAITVLFERTSHEDLEVFRVFEEAISILTEKMTTSFKSFRARGFRDKAIDYSDDALRTTNIRAKHKREGEIAEKQNRENTSALLELRDIEDELNTLKELFTVQASAIKIMKKGYQRPDLLSLTSNGLSFLTEAEQKLQEYTKHAVRMIESVKSTRDDFDKLLQMVQRQAQVDEVRLARLQADLASAQSRSVMIFTVFTVIFLPLTFFTGLFGMNTQEWGGSNFKTLRSIGIISLPASVAIIALALLVAWSTRMRRAWNSSVKSVKGAAWWVRVGVVSSVVKCFVFVEGEGREGGKERKRSYMEKRRRKKKEGQETWQDGGPDFWENHKAGRDVYYRVPLQNRITVVKVGNRGLRGSREMG